MREFTKSTLSFSWAMSLFGIKQLTNIMTLPASRRPMEDATTAFDSATQAMGGQFDTMLQGMFQAGNEMQRDLIDLMLGATKEEGIGPTNAWKLPAGMVQRSVGSVTDMVARQDSLLVGRELRNKVEVFMMVADVATKLGLTEEPPYPPMTELAGRVYELENYPALWAVEGLGHFYGDTFWKRNEVPHGIMLEEHTGDIPAKSLLMLHAGIGMSFAQHLFKGINHLSPPSKIRRMLQQFIELCKENSRPGYAGAAIESLGLVTRSGTFSGDCQPMAMCQIVSRELAQIDQEAYAYFWHGAGRATYFLPIHFVPFYGSIGHATEMLQRFAPDDEARRNAIGGLAWGVTMVNIRHPEIAAGWLKHYGEHLVNEEGFSNGVVSAIMMRYDTTPDEALAGNFFRYQPLDKDGQTVEWWQTQVTQPCEDALRYYHPALEKHQRLGDIFCYRDLPELVRQLEETVPTTAL
jgi:hypothetical protein